MTCRRPKRYAKAVHRSGRSCSTMVPSNATHTSGSIAFVDSEDGNRRTPEHPLLRVSDLRKRYMNRYMSECLGKLRDEIHSK